MAVRYSAWHRWTPGRASGWIGLPRCPDYQGQVCCPPWKGETLSIKKVQYQTMETHDASKWNHHFLGSINFQCGMGSINLINASYSLPKQPTPKRSSSPAVPSNQAQQYLRSTAQTGPGSLEAELERIPAEDGKELLRRGLAWPKWMGGKPSRGGGDGLVKRNQKKHWKNGWKVQHLSWLWRIFFGYDEV